MASNDALQRKHVVVLGVSHATSSVTLRDRCCFAESEIPAALAAIRSIEGISEALILSTCNRVEIYAVTSQPEEAEPSLSAFLSAFRTLADGELSGHTFFYRCEDAIAHLFRVATSLESLMVGEAQIIAQVKNALSLARESGSTSTVLNKLFQFAVTAGKRGRAETKIGEGAVSISQAGVELAKKILGKLQSRHCMIIGAGEMSVLTARHLKSAGIGRLYFANRTVERAVEIAREFDGTGICLDNMRSTMPECDIVISSTASPDYILGTDDMREVMAARNNRSILLIDIAAPRDIHPDVGLLYNVFLYTIDDLSSVAKFNQEMRAKEAELVEAIARDEMQKYFDWYNYLRVQPVMQSMRDRFALVRDRKLDQFSAELAALPQPAQQFVRQFIASYTDELLEGPSKTLRESSCTDDWIQFSDSLVRLFDLEPSK